MQTPFWLTNIKNYEAASNNRLVELAHAHQTAADASGKNIGMAVSPVDVHQVAQMVSVPVFSQHVDACEYGRHTGWILPEKIKAAGATGTLLNHSEHRIEKEVIKKTIPLCKAAGLQVIVCAESPEEIEVFKTFFGEHQPDAWAFEPPELIGSSTASVASATPDSIVESVAKSPNTAVMVGAGIASAQDVAVSLKLGAAGFLVASAIVKSEDPAKALEAFVAEF
jgi:triosephosphate isomerase